MHGWYIKGNLLGISLQQFLLTIQYNTINIHITMDVKTSAQLLQRHLIHHDKAKAQVKLIGRIL